MINKAEKFWKLKKSLYICKQKQKKFFERRNGGLPVNKITSEYISWESQRDVSNPLAEEKSPLCEKAAGQKHSGIALNGVAPGRGEMLCGGATRVTLMGNQDRHLQQE